MTTAVPDGGVLRAFAVGRGPVGVLVGTRENAMGARWESGEGWEREGVDVCIDVDIESWERGERAGRQVEACAFGESVREGGKEGVGKRTRR